MEHVRRRQRKRRGAGRVAAREAVRSATHAGTARPLSNECVDRRAVHQPRAARDAEALDVILADIHANRHSVEAISRVLDAYSTTITT